MVKFSPIVITLVSNSLWGIGLAADLNQSPDIKLNARNIIPISHGAGSQPAVAAGRPTPPTMQGFQSHLGQVKNVAPSSGFRAPMIVHQGFRPVVKAEAPPAPPSSDNAQGDGKPRGDQQRPPSGFPSEQNNENRDIPQPPPPPPSGNHNFENISPSLAPNDQCRNACKMNEGMTFVYCYQDCTHDPNWLLVPEDVEAASLPTNLMQPFENKQTTTNNNNSTDPSPSSVSSSKKPKTTYASDRTQIILTMDNNSGPLDSLHYSAIFTATLIAIIIF